LIGPAPRAGIDWAGPLGRDTRLCSRRAEPLPRRRRPLPLPGLPPGLRLPRLYRLAL